MELESKIFYSNEQIKKTETLSYSLSGMGGAGTLSIVKGLNSAGLYCVYIRCEAGLKSLFKMFDFEGLSLWESEKDGELKFSSFEEKDNIKKIYKKWEFSANQLQYTENKNGLFHEREVSYSLAGVSEKHRVFDPLSIIAFLHLEKLKPNVVNTIYIFGKQQLLKLNLETKSDGDDLKVLFNSSGMNSRWEKILEKTDMTLSREGHVKRVSIPSPLFIGKIEMSLKSAGTVDSKFLDKSVENFSKFT